MLAGKAEECNGDTQLRITQYGQFRCANNTGFVPIALQEGHCCYVYMLLLTNAILLLECKYSIKLLQSWVSPRQPQIGIAPIN